MRRPVRSSASTRISLAPGCSVTLALNWPSAPTETGAPFTVIVELGLAVPITGARDTCHSPWGQTTVSRISSGMRSGSPGTPPRSARVSVPWRTSTSLPPDRNRTEPSVAATDTRPLSSAFTMKCVGPSFDVRVSLAVTVRWSPARGTRANTLPRSRSTLTSLFERRSRRISTFSLSSISVDGPRLSTARAPGLVRTTSGERRRSPRGIGLHWPSR